MERIFGPTGYNRYTGNRGIRYICLLLVLILTACGTDEETESFDWAIALHGGAGDMGQISDEQQQVYLEALEAALVTGEEILSDGGSAVEAVEYVVRTLEDHPLFNAGRGSVMNEEGVHELDAAVMDGSTLDAGAVTGLRTVKNPVTLARHVMENSEHIFFSGEGAERFADGTQVERVDNEWFYTDRRQQQWQDALEQTIQEETEDDPSNGQSGNSNPEGERHGTVGAVALDQQGRLASATSTGGTANKMYGRVGDVPIIGSGTYANEWVAVSATGAGEEIMRHVSAHTIASYMEFSGGTVDEAMDLLLNDRLESGQAGFIAVDQYGNVSMKMNTPIMFRAGSNSGGFREVAIGPGE